MRNGNGAIAGMGVNPIRCAIGDSPIRRPPDIATISPRRLGLTPCHAPIVRLFPGLDLSARRWSERRRRLAPKEDYRILLLAVL